MTSTTLFVGRYYRSACPRCGSVVPIGGGTNVGGYRYSSHIPPNFDLRTVPTVNCDGSGQQLNEATLKQLAAA